MARCRLSCSGLPRGCSPPSTRYPSTSLGCSELRTCADRTLRLSCNSPAAPYWAARSPSCSTPLPAPASRRWMTASPCRLLAADGWRRRSARRPPGPRRPDQHRQPVKVYRVSRRVGPAQPACTWKQPDERTSSAATRAVAATATAPGGPERLSSPPPGTTKPRSAISWRWLESPTKQNDKITDAG